MNLFLRPEASYSGLAGFCGLTLTLLSCSAQANEQALDASLESKSTSAPPNLVVFLTDDTRYDWFGFEGHPFVETPTFDRLAVEGTRFTHSFVTTSLCCPSRASLLTGMYAHRHGVTTNLEGDLAPALATFPMLLQAAGWSTAFIGKWHMGEDAEPRPGFDHWVSFAGQGTYFDPDFNVNGIERRAEGYVTDLLTDQAVEWLEQQAGDRPFCLILSHKATHSPMAPPARLRDHYKEREIEVPPGSADDLSGKPEILRRAALYGFTTRELEEQANLPVPDRVPNRKWDYAPYVRRYLETLVSVDQSLARLVSTLERLELQQRTVLLVTSDNGYLFGEHHAPDKRLAWEESIRVPLLVHAPGRFPEGALRNELVLNVDIAPTLLELAGLEIPGEMQGSSFAPLLRGEPVPWRAHFFYSYFRERTLAGVPTTLAIRTQDWKYTFYPDALAPNEELYDLAGDPNELTNLALEPEQAQRVSRMRQLLASEQTATGFTLPPQAQPPAIDRAPDDELLTLTEARAGVGVRAGEAKLEIRGLDLDDHTFRVRLELWAESDGRLLTFGTEQNGFVLDIDAGHPVFELRATGRVRRLRGDSSILGRAAELELGIDLAGHAYLALDGSARTRAPIAMLPPRRTGGVLRVGPDGVGKVKRLTLTTDGLARHE